MFEIIDIIQSKYDPWSLERFFFLPVERVLKETHTHGLFVGYDSTTLKPLHASSVSDPAFQNDPDPASYFDVDPDPAF